MPSNGMYNTIDEAIEYCEVQLEKAKALDELLLVKYWEDSLYCKRLMKN